ncbi:unnamed protein product [Darwinula stevensoni]|uniref:ENTH domain-containing protein n=1 Tax=Darwinula stevensoni TaxID=69355 RepID=A0A7R9AHD5_9CRUS|nr:unnamed protein product [Darwinula stevensoni]CAG0904607.1 unnamed protein product [Darwinula stevensoni]
MAVKLKKNMKNLSHNYTKAQAKVGEATSNDPWGPSCTLMSQIADMTHNIDAFGEIMQMIWKRLNDHGKNWRHVYKALVLLEYLIKRGNVKVAQQCKENIFAIQTLRDFQHLEEKKDFGLKVREKSKQVVALLTDEGKLYSEKARALKARERFSQPIVILGSETNTTMMDAAKHENILASSPFQFGGAGAPTHLTKTKGSASASTFIFNPTPRFPQEYTLDPPYNMTYLNQMQIQRGLAMNATQQQVPPGAASQAPLVPSAPEEVPRPRSRLALIYPETSRNVLDEKFEKYTCVYPHGDMRNSEM